MMELDAKEKGILILLVIVAAGAIWMACVPHDTAFTIAARTYHAPLISVESLSKALGMPVVLKTFSSDRTLHQAIEESNFDAYIVSDAYYLKTLPQHAGSIAVLGVPSNRILLVNTTLNPNASGEQKEKRMIGISDPSLAHLLIQKTFAAKDVKGVLTTVEYADDRRSLQALHDHLIQYAVVHEDALIGAQPQDVVLNSLSGLGIAEDVFVISEKWHLSEPTSEATPSDKIRAALETLSPPQEAVLMFYMSYLFKQGELSTRYYYKDLVYMP